jgi:hypothetical protein
LYQKDQSGFVPTYKALFPEYFATALQTETIIRDLAPLTSDIYGTKHGRYARSNDGVIVANPVWITEINTNPAEVDPSITSEKALALKAKTIARTLCFYLNKGVTQVHLFASIAGGDKNMSIIQQNFVEYAQQPGAVYPIDDTSYTSPGLAVIGRMVEKMNEERDPNLISPRSLQVISISDTHNHYQFLGDRTTAHPTLYDRNVFAFLPFQLNSRRFVIPYYVMTRDVTKDLPLEQFTVQIKGIKGDGASVNVYDPLNDRTIPVTVIGRSSDSLSLKLTATDYPYLLTVEEAMVFPFKQFAIALCPLLK